MPPHFLTGLVFLFVFSVSTAQPTPRASAQLIYFKPTQSLVLIDGYEKGTMPTSGKSETWAWKNNSWTKLDETDQPLRSLSAAVYMSIPGYIFVFGGVGSRGYDDSLRDAYTYDGSKWSGISNIGLGTRDHHEMVYDGGMPVLYGGQTGNREFDTKTWVYKAGAWIPLNIPGPGGRVHHAMAYDAERKKTVLYGGSGPERAFDETWEFDGTQWTKIETTTNPGARTHHAMVYDPSRKKVLLYGGGIGMELQNDIWAWEGKTWEKLSSDGPARVLPAMAFNTDNNKLYVFGGNGGQQMMSIYSDLWEWDGQSWKQVDKGKVYAWDNGKDRYVEKE